MERNCKYSAHRGGIDSKYFTTTALLFPLALLGAPSALAQQAAASPEGASVVRPASQEASAGGLEEILVTARRRVETVQDAPLAVTALSEKVIERYDLTNLEKASSLAPQLVIARGGAGSGAQISLRGVGSNFSSVGIEQSVAVILDGVYYGQGRIINEGFFDSTQIEILKGPQALFFGKNATAGVISITTGNPTDKFEALGRVSYEFNSKNLIGDAVASGPLTETLGARLAVRASKMWGGYFDNRGGSSIYPVYDVATGNTSTLTGLPADRIGPKERQLLARLTLRWEPTDELTATLKASGNLNRTNNPAWNVVPICPGPNQQVAPASPCERKFNIYQSNMPTEMAASGVPYARDGQLGNRYKSFSVTGTVNYNTDDIGFTLINNYHKYNNQLIVDYFYESPTINGANGGGWATERSKWHAFSTEGRMLTSFDGPLNLLAGFYYQKTKLNNDLFPLFAGLENTAAPAGMRYVGAWKSSFTNGETISGFGQAIYKPAETVELTGGVRYIHETKDSIYIQPYANPALIPAIYLVDEPVIGDQTFNNWSPEATISWKPQSDITIYGAYKTGYKSGGFSNNSIYGSNTQPGDLDFEGERAKGFEAGFKSTLFDRQLNFNLTAYRYKYSNLQVDFYNASLISFVTTNAGSAIVKGIELETEFAPRGAPGLNIRGSLNYNRGRYQNFLGPCYGGQTLGAGCSLTGPGGAAFQDLSGKPIANAPLWTASLGFNYDVPVSDDMVFGLAADGRYSSSYFASPFNADLSRQSRYAFLNATMRLAEVDNRWEVALIGRNLTNRFIISGVYDITGTGSGTGTPIGISADQAASVALPRTVQLQFTWRY